MISLVDRNLKFKIGGKEYFLLSLDRQSPFSITIFLRSSESLQIDYLFIPFCHPQIFGICVFLATAQYQTFEIMPPFFLNLPIPGSSPVPIQTTNKRR